MISSFLQLEAVSFRARIVKIEMVVRGDVLFSSVPTSACFRILSGRCVGVVEVWGGFWPRV